MGTQREIAGLIVEKNGHYLLALKNNQQSLFEDVECAFKMHNGYDVHETLEADHGRIETRKCSILPACKFLPEENLAPWKNLKTLIRPEAKRVKYRERLRRRFDIISVMNRKQRRLISVHLSEGTGV
jgi:hypothetical protein